MVLLAVLCGLLGLIVGSFLNVVVWRVPRGESVISPPSHCPSCDTPIRPYDNVPVVSWLVLRGRCRDCRAPISPRYPLVELGTGVLFAAMAVRFGFDDVLPAYLYLAAISVALTLIDVDVHRLPDAITLPSYVVGAALLAIPGEWDVWIRALLGMVTLYLVYFAMRVAAPRGMGGGDVKLAGVLGLYLGWLGWDVWALGLIAGFLAGGLFGVALLATGRGGRKTKVPYGPFMVVGALLAVFAGDPVTELWLGV